MKTVVGAVLFVAVLLIAAYTVQVLLVVFAGILLAVLLRSVAEWLHQHSKLSQGAALAVVVLAIGAILVANILLFGVSFAAQVDEIRSSISASWEKIKTYAAQYEWSRALVSSENQSSVMAGAPAAVSITLGFIGWLVLMIFVALYTAANPRVYIGLFTSLFSKRHQAKVASTLTDLASVLRNWLLGQMISMAIVGVVTTLALSLMGVPMAFTLGFLTAILNFIPNVGAILAAGIAALLALTQSVELAGYVLLLFVVIQCVEGYVLTPLIQQRTVELPPALAIVVQALMGVLTGGIGLALAAPLTVVGLALTRKLYLKEDVSGPGVTRAAG